MHELKHGVIDNGEVRDGLNIYHEWLVPFEVGRKMRNDSTWNYKKARVWGLPTDLVSLLGTVNDDQEFQYRENMFVVRKFLYTLNDNVKMHWLREMSEKLRDRAETISEMLATLSAEMVEMHEHLDAFRTVLFDNEVGKELDEMIPRELILEGGVLPRPRDITWEEAKEAAGKILASEKRYVSPTMSDDEDENDWETWREDDKDWNPDPLGY